jgi:hypothetical protein
VSRHIRERRALCVYRCRADAVCGSMFDSLPACRGLENWHPPYNCCVQLLRDVVQWPITKSSAASASKLAKETQHPDDKLKRIELNDSNGSGSFDSSVPSYPLAPAQSRPLEGRRIIVTGAVATR